MKILEYKMFFFRDNLETQIIQKINSSQDSVIVANFLFDYKPIADALIKARERGVKIEVLIDYRSTATVLKDRDEKIYEVSVDQYLEVNGINVYVYKRFPLTGNGIMHHKFVLIDDVTILYGSHNFDKSSTEYVDSMMQIESAEIYSYFYEEFIRLKSISEYNALKKHKTVGVYFSADKIDDFVVSQINKATENIIVVHAFFDYKPIADALLKAKNNNVEVVVLTDISSKNRQMVDANSNYGLPLLSYLSSGGIKEIYIYNPEEKMHNKYILIDNIYSIYGSYNLHKKSAVFDEESVIAFESKEVYSYLHDEYIYLKNKADKYFSRRRGGGGGTIVL